jgi:hypothetical protein
MRTAIFTTDQVGPLNQDDGTTEAHTRSGSVVTVIRPLLEHEHDADETGPMFKVRFSDGLVADVFEDELADVPRGEG